MSSPSRTSPIGKNLKSRIPKPKSGNKRSVNKVTINKAKPIPDFDKLHKQWQEKFEDGLQKCKKPCTLPVSHQMRNGVRATNGKGTQAECPESSDTKRKLSISNKSCSESRRSSKYKNETKGVKPTAVEHLTKPVHAQLRKIHAQDGFYADPTSLASILGNGSGNKQDNPPSKTPVRFSIYSKNEHTVHLPTEDVLKSFFQRTPLKSLNNIIDCAPRSSSRSIYRSQVKTTPKSQGMNTIHNGGHQDLKKQLDFDSEDQKEDEREADDLLNESMLKKIKIAEQMLQQELELMQQKNLPEDELIKSPEIPSPTEQHHPFTYAAVLPVVTGVTKHAETPSDNAQNSSRRESDPFFSTPTFVHEASPLLSQYPLKKQKNNVLNDDKCLTVDERSDHKVPARKALESSPPNITTLLTNMKLDETCSLMLGELKHGLSKRANASPDSAVLPSIPVKDAEYCKAAELLVAPLQATHSKNSNYNPDSNEENSEDASENLILLITPSHLQAQGPDSYKPPNIVCLSPPSHFSNLIQETTDVTCAPVGSVDMMLNITARIDDNFLPIKPLDLLCTSPELSDTISLIDNHIIKSRRRSASLVAQTHANVEDKHELERMLLQLEQQKADIQRKLNGLRAANAVGNLPAQMAADVCFSEPDAVSSCGIQGEADETILAKQIEEADGSFEDELLAEGNDIVSFLLEPSITQMKGGLRAISTANHGVRRSKKRESINLMYFSPKLPNIMEQASDIDKNESNFSDPIFNISSWELELLKDKAASVEEIQLKKPNKRLSINLMSFSPKLVDIADKVTDDKPKKLECQPSSSDYELFETKLSPKDNVLFHESASIVPLDSHKHEKDNPFFPLDGLISSTSGPYSAYSSVTTFSPDLTNKKHSDVLHSPQELNSATHLFEGDKYETKQNHSCTPSTFGLFSAFSRETNFTEDSATGKSLETVLRNEISLSLDTSTRDCSPEDIAVSQVDSLLICMPKIENTSSSTGSDVSCRMAFIGDANLSQEIASGNSFNTGAPDTISLPSDTRHYEYNASQSGPSALQLLRDDNHANGIVDMKADSASNKAVMPENFTSHLLPTSESNTTPDIRTAENGSHGFPTPVCFTRFKLKAKKVEDNNSPDLMVKVTHKNLSERFVNVLLDNEVSLYTCSIGSHYVTDIDQLARNPVARCLLYGDEQHFIPIKENNAEPGVEGSASHCFTV